MLQLGVEHLPGIIDWIEPVDVWGGFRAGRKAQPRDRTYGQTEEGICFAAGSHNGFDHIGASHHRQVTLRDPQPSHITLQVLDTVITRVPLHVRQWWHPGPQLNRGVLDQLFLKAPTLRNIQFTWHSTWFSTGFGQRLPRESLCISGRLYAGQHQLCCSLPLLHLVR